MAVLVWSGWGNGRLQAGWQKVTAHSSEGWESEIRVPAWLGDPLLGHGLHWILNW